MLANGSLSSNQSGEGDIGEALVRANLVDCIVTLPKQLFYNTGIPACIWFLRRGRTKQETLFIDASNMGYMEDRTHRAFAEEDIVKIRDTYLNWKKDGEYDDEKGFCKSADLVEFEKHSFILTPGRYVGIPDEEKIATLTGKLKAQVQRESELNEEIQTQLAKVGITLNF